MLLLVAIVSGAFFQGIYGELLVATQVALFVGAAIVLWFGRTQQLRFSITSLTACVTLYWMWLAVTLIWSPVPFYSAFLFWWMGSLPLAFWLQTLASQWKWQHEVLRPGIAALAVMLALGGIVEFHLWHTGPQLMFLNRNAYAGLINVVAIPATAYLALAFSARKASRYRTLALGLAVFLLVYAMALTTGRGPLIAFVSGAAIVGVALYRHAPARAWWAGAIAMAAIVLAHIDFGQSAMVTGAAGRFAQLADQHGSVWQRWLIWKSSWDLLADSAWWGIGLGVYGLAWQRYRHADDRSGDTMAHNDYLQLWIEAGLPGLILFLAVLIAASWTFLRIVRGASPTLRVRAEAAGLYAGVFATALHSLVDMNFYVLSTLILCGMMLARLEAIRAGLDAVRVVVVRPSKWITPVAYRILVLLLLALPLLYFASISMAIYETRRAMAYAKVGRFDLAEYLLIRATRLNPVSDDVRMVRANMYRQAIKVLPAASPERANLFVLARGLLDEAERLNPFRLETRVIRASLYRENPHLLRPDALAQTRAAFDRALEINPRALDLRYDYAGYLLAQGATDAAREVLDAGLRSVQFISAGFAPYYALTIRVRRETGDEAGAAKLEAQVREFGIPLLESPDGK